MEANNPCNARRKPPPARLTAAPTDAAWHEISALRMIAGVAIVLIAWCAIELILAGWQWLDAAIHLARDAATRDAVMLPILTTLARDPNISGAFRRAIDTRQPRNGLLDAAFDKAAPRRFTGAPPSAFAGLDDGLESVICGDCNGSGEGMHDGASCGTCGGTGEVLE